MTKLSCRKNRQGRDKVDLHVDVNLGEFGLLVGKELGGLATRKDAISEVLSSYSFPQLNIVFSASARLLDKDDNDLEVESRLDEMEVRLAIAPLDADGKVIRKAKPPGVEVLGIFPYETAAGERVPTLGLSPNVSSVLEAVNGISPALAGAVSGLGLSFESLARPRFPIVHKAFLSGADSFGWYVRSREEDSHEGLHYGVAILQTHRDVAAIRVEGALATDWIEGGVDNQVCTFRTDLKVHHPPRPITPIVPSPQARELPVLLDAPAVMDLLGITPEEFDSLVSSDQLVAFGRKDDQADGRVVTTGSFLRLMGLK